MMDIKMLREANADGLEQWAPVMQAGIPLQAADAKLVFESPQRPVSSMSSASFALNEFLEEFAKLGGAERILKVCTRRTHYTVDGCTAEFSEVVANGRPTRTIAVQSTDAEAVNRAIRELVLGGYGQ